MTNSEFNTIKINLYCKLGEATEAYINHAKYSIKSCGVSKDKLVLASAMLNSVCRLCIDDEDENYCLTGDEICQITTFICSLIKSCNCN